MNILLWILQGLLAALYLAHGALMIFPPAQVLVQMNAAGLVLAYRLFIGIAEVLAAIGLTLPGVTRNRPWLIPWAAAGLMIVMASATIFHSVRRETSSAATTFVLLVLVTFVAYMRWKVRPIAPRA